MFTVKPSPHRARPMMSDPNEKLFQAKDDLIETLRAHNDLLREVAKAADEFQAVCWIPAR